MTEARVSVAVMAHPARAAYVPSLVAALDTEPAVVWDRYNSRWDTGRRAMLAHHPDATHHVVVQDDAVVCDDLVATVAAMTRIVPAGRPIGLYVGSRRPQQPLVSALHRRAVDGGRRWITMRRSPMWGVGLVFPVDQIGDVVSWAARSRVPAYDGRIRRWWHNRGIEQWYAVPSPVDHRAGPETSSLVSGRRNDGRVAFSFVGAGVSGLDVDWDTPPVRG